MTFDLDIPSAVPSSHYTYRRVKVEGQGHSTVHDYKIEKKTFSPIDAPYEVR